MRYGIFVYDPDGDMGYGVIIGAFKTAEAADRDVERIRRAVEARKKDPRIPAGYSGEQVECIVVPLVSGGTAASEILGRVME
jgi:hypothetical protein